MKTLTTKQIHEQIKNYFSIGELCDQKTVSTYGERAWRFFDEKLLHTILILREQIGKPIYINHAGMQQRGLRTNVSPMVIEKTDARRLYLSAHMMGKAVDLDVKGMTAEEVRNWIEEHQHLFPYKIRLEDNVTWVHIDVVWESKNPKVYRFDP